MTDNEYYVHEWIFTHEGKTIAADYACEFSYEKYTGDEGGMIRKLSELYRLNCDLIEDDHQISLEPDHELAKLCDAEFIDWANDYFPFRNEMSVHRYNDHIRESLTPVKVKLP